jgi:hypothetical protein
VGQDLHDCDPGGVAVKECCLQREAGHSMVKIVKHCFANPVFRPRRYTQSQYVYPGIDERA